MNNINSASIIVELEHMLKEDIDVLSNIKLQPDDSKELLETITSLIESKKHILDLLPDNVIDIKSGAHPPQVNRLPKYTSSKNQLSSKSEMLIKAFLEIESKQQEYIENAMSGDGLPNSFTESLRSVLSVYHKINTQLKRMVSTNQLHAIVSN